MLLQCLPRMLNRGEIMQRFTELLYVQRTLAVGLPFFLPARVYMLYGLVPGAVHKQMHKRRAETMLAK
jgi:hypothetical protein